MYLGIDIGGTKTLVAVFNEQGTVIEEAKFPTPQDYSQFMSELQKATNTFNAQRFIGSAVGMPGLVSRQEGVSVSAGPNLNWHNATIAADLQKIFNCPVVVENDANVAAVFEARQILDKYTRVLYVTISTGIGGGLVFNGQLEPNMLNSEVGHMLVKEGNEFISWEDLASGKKIVEKYGKRASDITDDVIWQEIVPTFGVGIVSAMALYNPLDAVIFGGGVGAHFDRFGEHLADFLKDHADEIIQRPELLMAQHPEEAVIYGCYELAKQQNE